MCAAFIRCHDCHVRNRPVGDPVAIHIAGDEFGKAIGGDLRDGLAKAGAVARGHVFGHGAGAIHRRADGRARGLAVGQPVAIKIHGFRPGQAAGGNVDDCLRQQGSIAAFHSVGLGLASVGIVNRLRDSGALVGAIAVPVQPVPPHRTVRGERGLRARDGRAVRGLVRHRRRQAAIGRGDLCFKLGDIAAAKVVAADGDGGAIGAGLGHLGADQHAGTGAVGLANPFATPGQRLGDFAQHPVGHTIAVVVEFGRDDQAINRGGTGGFGAK